MVPGLAVADESNGLGQALKEAIAIGANLYYLNALRHLTDTDLLSLALGWWDGLAISILHVSTGVA